MTDPSPSDPCAICGGPRSEHTPDKTRHQFTLEPNDLKPWPVAQPSQAQGPMRVPAAADVSPAVGRLVGVLLEKGILEAPEALYVMGVVERPASSVIHFRDPVNMGFGAAAPQ